MKILYILTLHVLVLFGAFTASLCENENHGLGERYEVTWLESSEKHTVPKGNEELARIFCHCGDKHTVISSLRSVYIDLQCSSSHKLFEGINASEVVQQYKAHLSSWLPLLPWRQSQFAIPVFTNYCIGITSDSPYTVSLIVRKINYWRVLQLFSGIALFLAAPTLCHNICFYYATGISVGVVASIVFLVLFLSRLMPKKSAAYSVLFLGWSMVLYIMQLLWFNLREILLDYSNYLLAYIGLSALTSFAICYRYKPMTDPRSQDLMQWAFQIAGLLLVFFSSEFQEFTMAIIIITLTLYCFPAVWTAKMKTWWWRKFPPKIKLLSEAEYIQQGCEETRRGMQELRSFCQSPQCQTWRMVSRLKDPLRFARFVEGESHLTDEEILKYDTHLISGSSFEEQLTDDDSSNEREINLNHTPSTSSLRNMFSERT